MASDKQALSALDEIDQILQGRVTRRNAVAGPASPTARELEIDYEQIRARLDVALTLIDKIPIYGRKIGTAVRFLIQVGDHALSSRSEHAFAPCATPRQTERSLSSFPPLFHLGHTPSRAQTRRREPGSESHVPSADGSQLIGVI
jgi:hypothetical protein